MRTSTRKDNYFHVPTKEMLYIPCFCPLNARVAASRGPCEGNMALLLRAFLALFSYYD